MSAEYQRFERRNDRLKANDQRMHERKRVLQLPPLSLIQIKEWIDGNPRGRSMQAREAAGRPCSVDDVKAAIDVNRVARDQLRAVEREEDWLSLGAPRPSWWCCPNGKQEVSDCSHAKSNSRRRGPQLIFVAGTRFSWPGHGNTDAAKVIILRLVAFGGG